MHPKHELLLKKNARKIQSDFIRAFYFAEDKATTKTILHIDRKIRKATRFGNLKKVNTTLEAFNDKDYTLGSKARMCAGMVGRDEQGLVFTIDIKKGLAAAQLARSLKKFKKLIGKARVQEGKGKVDEDTTPDSAPDEEADARLLADMRAELKAANLAEELQGTREQIQGGLSSFLLQQQQIFRKENTQLDGRLTPEELSFTDSSGAPVKLDASFLKSSGLSRAFTLNADGSLQLKPAFLTEEGISEEAREKLSAALLSASAKGYVIQLNNPHGGRDVGMELRSDGTHFEAEVTRIHPASKTNLAFDRGDEIIPGSEPPRTFGETITAMGKVALDDTAGFNALNQTLLDAFELEKATGRLAKDMTFQQYKMQFIQLDVQNVDENGLQWHDGSGHLDAAEWAFLQQKVKDLPGKAQFYFWMGYKKKKSSKELNWDKTPFPVDFRKKGGKKKFDEYIKKYYNTKEWTFKLGNFAYALPGKEDLLPKVNNIPPQILRTLLADADGAVQDPLTKAPLDPTDAASLSSALDSTTKVISNTVMEGAMTAWTENSGQSIGSLLERIPDTQKIFLRQSNGTANFDTVAGEKIGQETVTQVGVDGDGHLVGNNDNGAFGKCAPTSYFCGAITGIGVATRDGLDELKKDPLTKALGTQIEAMLTAVPTNEESRQKLESALNALNQKLVAAWNKIPASNKKERKRIYDLYQNYKHALQMKTSVVDRLVVQTDEEGPYMEMSFLVPDSRTDPYLRDKKPPLTTKDTKVTVKVRPADIQEYLEQTNRSDDYRGGKQHMMDFFKDPSSMNQIQLMKDLGPGMIAVGIDKALKGVGKKSGLLYGPGSRMVASMVYNENRAGKGGYTDLTEPITDKKGSKEFEQKFQARRKGMIDMLRKGRENGGGMAVSMGYNMDTGHVNYIQAWGTPRIEGVEISADDLARCHMNHVENAGTSSAWQGDRNSDTLINTGKMIQGLSAIHQKLSGAGKGKMADQLQGLIDKATDAQAQMDKAARSAGYRNSQEWVAAAQTDWGASDSLMKFKQREDNEALDAVRAASADTMAWIKENLSLDHEEGNLNEDNVVIMPSNTERDNSVTDSETDRDRVGGGNIGAQKYGSANAADASYFVPVNAMASGWDKPIDKDKDGNKTTDASRYNYSDDPTDQFIMLSDMELM